MELKEIIFAEGEDRRAVLIGDNLPFKHATIFFHYVPGGAILLTLSEDKASELAAKKPLSWWERLWV